MESALSIIDLGSNVPAHSELKESIQRYESASRYWHPKIDYNRKLMRTYRQEMQLSTDQYGHTLYPFRSKLFMPEAFHLCETAFVNISEAIFVKDDFVSISPGRGQIDVQSAFKTERILKQQLRARNFKANISPILLQTVLLGSAEIRTTWVYETRLENQIRYRRKFGYIVGIDEFQNEVEIYDGPDFYPVPFYCFFPDPYTKPGRLETAEYITEEIVQPYADFMADAEYFGYISEGIDWVKEQFTKGVTVKAQYDERGQPSSDDEQRRVRLILCHDHDKVVYTASTAGSNEGAVVRICDLSDVSPSGKYPYCSYQLRPTIDEGVSNTSDTPEEYFPGGFFPLGELHSLQDLNESINALINMRYDVALIGMNPPWVMRSGSLKDETILEDGMTPGRIVMTEDDYGRSLHETIQQVSISDFMGPAFNNLREYLIDTEKRASGVEDAIAGRIDPANRTATGVMQTTTNAAHKFLHKAKNIVNSGMIEHLMRYNELNAKYLSPDTELYLTGRPDLPPAYVSAEDIIRGCNFVIKPSAIINRMILSRMIVEFMPWLLRYPKTNTSALFRTLVENLEEIFDDPSLIIPDEDQPIIAAQIQMFVNEQAQKMKETRGGNAGSNINLFNANQTDSGAEVQGSAGMF